MQDSGSLLVDDLIGGHLVEAFSGTDACTESYSCLHLQLETRQIVKVVRESIYRHDPVFREYFLQEMQKIVHFRHRNVLQVCDVGWDEKRDILYYVQEKFDGKSLRQRLADEPQLSREKCLCIVRAVADVLQDAAKAGIPVLYNLSPENIFLTDADDLLMISEPGWSFPPEDERPDVTLRNADFSAPELAEKGIRGSFQTDICSLGTLWLTMLAGESAHNAAGATLQSLNPAVSEPCAELILQMLDPDPEKRPGTPEKFLAELIRLPDALALNDPELRKLAIARIDQTVSEQLGRFSASLQIRRQKEQTRWRLLLAGLGVLAGILLLVLLIAWIQSFRLGSRYERVATELRALQRQTEVQQKVPSAESPQKKTNDDEGSPDEQLF